MEWNFNIKYLPILFVFLVATIFLCYQEDLTTTRILFSSDKLASNHFTSTWLRVGDDLQTALAKASANKTLIIAVINEAYVEPSDGEYPSMFDLFLEGFWVGEETRPLIRRLLVVSMDTTAYERCRFRRLNCYLLAAEGGFSGEKLYMSGEFIEMMWRRTAFLLDILKRGYDFIFTDADVIWLRNPLPRLRGGGKFDLQISTDRFNGDALSVTNPINTGFYMVRSNSKTTSLFQKWYDMRSNWTGMKEQDVLQRLITDEGALGEFGVKARFLDTQYFSGFCSDSQDSGSVVTIHANCCRTIKAKIMDLRKVLMDWKRIQGDSESWTADLRWSAHTACANSWSRKDLL